MEWKAEVTWHKGPGCKTRVVLDQGTMHVVCDSCLCSSSAAATYVDAKAAHTFGAGSDRAAECIDEATDQVGFGEVKV